MAKKDLNAINKEFLDFLKSLPEDVDQEEVKKAYEFAKKAHVFQTRKSGEPYISHPLEVAKIANSLGLDQVSIICALLHDTVEDTDVTIEQIGEEFGIDVMNVVEGLTKITSFGRKKEEVDVDALRKILLASTKDIRILVIKLCDRLHNMRTLEYRAEDKRQRIATETLTIYVPIAQKVGMYSLKWELEDLSMKYQNPEMYQYIKTKINLTRGQREEIVQKAVLEVKDTLAVNGVDAIVLGRPKNFYSIYKKIRDKTKSLEDIFDLYALRVIVKDIAECYAVLGITHEKFQSFPNKLKDYISNPKANGYQSIHTVIYSERLKGPVEVQIRTEEMHKLAEFGIAAHWKYKSLDEDKKFDKRISWLREVLQWEKEHQDNYEFLKLLRFDFFEDEIFVFTPKNDVHLLPEHATVVDFAYAIHTELGERAYKAKINGKIATLDTELKSGDIVEIITHKTAKPSEKWLRFVKTNKARIKIRQALHLKHSGKKEKVELPPSFEEMKSKITRLNEYKKVRKAGCCDFNYGDQLVGVISKDKELVVHNASCENAKYSLNARIQLRWIEEREKKVTLNIILRDKIGLLMDILNRFSEKNINIMSMNSKILKNGNVKLNIELLDGPYIPKLIQELKKMKNVESITLNDKRFSVLPL